MILVTGGTGFLGTALIRQLVAGEKQIRALKRDSSHVPQDLATHPKIEWVNGELNNYFELEDAFDQVTQVYHCAAMVSFDPADKQRLLQVNGEGTAHIANLALDHGARLLHVSSIAAIGEPSANETLSSEKNTWQFNGRQSGYAISKYAGEMEVWRAMEEGLDGVIINPSVIIGQSAGTKGSGALFHLVKNGINYFPGGTIGVVDVEDVAKVAIALMDAASISHERFILNAENISYEQLFSKTAQHLGVKAPSKKLKGIWLEAAWRFAKFFSVFSGKTLALTKDTARAAQKHQSYSNQKIRQLLGFDFRPLDNTIKEIAHAINNHARND